MIKMTIIIAYVIKFGGEMQGLPGFFTGSPGCYRVIWYGFALKILLADGALSCDPHPAAGCIGCLKRSL